MGEDKHREFGPWLRAHRESKGISASKMSRILDMAWSHYHDMEKGKWGAPRDFDKLKLIADVVDVPLAEVWEVGERVPPNWLEVAGEELIRRAHANQNRR